MTAQTAAMWEVYEFRGHRVVVIQQWIDPYGRRMVRVQLADGGEDQALGLSEQDFLAEARSMPCRRGSAVSTVVTT